MLVEIIVGKNTGDVALATALDYVRVIGKTPIVVNDSRGFFANRCVLRLHRRRPGNADGRRAAGDAGEMRRHRRGVAAAASPRWRDRSCGSSRQNARSPAGCCSTARTCTRCAGAICGRCAGRARRWSSRARCTRSTPCSGSATRSPSRSCCTSRTCRQPGVTAGRRPARAGRPAGGAGAGVPAPALRRPAAAGDDRDGAGLPARG